MKSTIEEDIRFIEEELLPEMVHNRCFCESNSREFIELESIKVEPSKIDSYHLQFTLYSAEIVIQFSSEPKNFYVLIKLLPENSLLTNDSETSLAYDGFLNEEIMWNKGSIQYGKSFFPKIYAADMGKYNRPVIVVENLEKNGFVRILDRELNLEEASLVMKLIGKFHGKGMNLKKTKFSFFRELYVKFQEIIFSKSVEIETEEKLMSLLNQVKSTLFDEKRLNKFERIFGNEPYKSCKQILSDNIDKSTSTICQGLMFRENLWFRNNEEMELKILDWQHVRYGSNSIDLATILTQSETTLWEDLIKIYANAVQQEEPGVLNEDLYKEITDSSFVYAFIILSLKNNQLPQFLNILENL